jgi:HD-like signal output (HDOD) protein
VNRKPRTQSAIQGECRNHLASIVSEGLEPFRPCVFDLDVLLSAPVVDLKKVSRILSCDAGFGSRVLRLSNSILLRSNETARTIADAIVLLGPCLFHTAVLLCAVTEFGTPASRDLNAETFWPHSVQMGVISERIAQQSEYPVRGAAYLAGVLHDIGYLPLLMVAREREKTSCDLAVIQWRDRIDVERDIFGLDHCQVGRWMAKLWGFSPSLTDAVLFHHDPSGAENDPHLAEIVCAAEYFCSEPFRQEVTVRRNYAQSSRIM